MSNIIYMLLVAFILCQIDFFSGWNFFLFLGILRCLLGEFRELYSYSIMVNSTSLGNKSVSNPGSTSVAVVELTGLLLCSPSTISFSLAPFQLRVAMWHNSDKWQKLTTCWGAPQGARRLSLALSFCSPSLFFPLGSPVMPEDAATIVWL